MGRDPAQQAAPDLFSTDAVRDVSASQSKPISAEETTTETAPQKHILPKNLRRAVTQLSDGELDELFQMTLAEAKRRGRLPRSIAIDSTSVPHRPSDLVTKRSLPTDKRTQSDNAELPLSRSQVIAIRAAFNAGVKPSQIARHFGISQSNVRKALATDPSK
jgi:hypothetical protein